MKHSQQPYLKAFAGFNLLILISLLITPLSLTAQQPAATGESENTVPFELVRLDWEETVAAGDTLVVDNRWGDIHLRQTGAKAVTYHAVMQKIGEQPKVGELIAEREDGKVTLRIAYPEGQQPASPQEGRVDAAILVPYDVKLEVIAERGKVSSKTMESPVKITAVDQPISLKSASSVNISANAAEVDLQFVPRKDDDDSRDRGRIQTITGDINIRYYPEMSMRFEMISGRPKTTTDLELLRNRELVGRQVNMHTGKNPEKLYLQSDTGYIRLVNTGSEILLETPEE